MELDPMNKRQKTAKSGPGIVAGKRKFMATAAAFVIAAGGALLLPSALLADAPNTNAKIPRAKDSWSIMAGSSLRNTLTGWCRVAGWTLIWDSPDDYRPRASATYQGSFEYAASSLIDSIYIGNPELLANFHRGNKVLYIYKQTLSSN